MAGKSVLTVDRIGELAPCSCQPPSGVSDPPAEMPTGGDATVCEALSELIAGLNVTRGALVAIVCWALSGDRAAAAASAGVDDDSACMASPGATIDFAEIEGIVEEVRCTVDAEAISLELPMSA